MHQRPVARAHARVRALALASCVATAVAALAACGGSPPPVEKPVVEVPKELSLDPSLASALKDPRYGEFRAAVKDLRTASQALTDYLKSIGGKPTTETEATRYTELADAVSARKAATNQIMSQEQWSEDDRKVMRAIFAAPDAALQ